VCVGGGAHPPARSHRRPGSSDPDPHPHRRPGRPRRRCGLLARPSRAAASPSSGPPPDVDHAPHPPARCRATSSRSAAGRNRLPPSGPPRETIRGGGGIMAALRAVLQGSFKGTPEANQANKAVNAARPGYVTEAQRGGGGADSPR
jgi:hypothetical protein